MPDIAAPATFVFADIAGFTALTEAHGDEHAAAVVDAFCATVDAELPPRATRVKTIGDAVMLRVADPSEAIHLGLRLTGSAEHGEAAVRVGLHHGAAIERDGDYFGAAVNLAARVASVAAGGEVLTTGDTASLAPDLEGVLYESRGRQSLRNIREPVELFAVLPLKTSGRLPVDPVCGMAVDPDRSPGRLTYEGTTYFFCSLACAGVFAGDPSGFAG
jgi:adenylate cyclase